MRSRQIGFALVTAFVLVSALYTGEALYYYALCVMAGILLISVVSLAFISIQFNYLQALSPASGTKGETLYLDITLYNDTLFIFPYIRLHYQLLPSREKSIKRSASFSVLPRSNARIREKIDCPFRGRFSIGLMQVDFCDIFGILLVTRRLEANQWQKPLTLQIRPRIVAMESLPLPAQEVESVIPQHTHQTEDTAQINSLREYQDGDTLRKVHWKATARTGILMIKEYELQATASPMVYLDCNTLHLEAFDRLLIEDLLIECAVAAGSYLLKAGLSMDLVVHNPQRAQQHFGHLEEFGALYQYLSDFQFAGNQPIEGILLDELSQMYHVGCVYIITQEITAQTYDLLIQLSKTSHIDITVFWAHLTPEEDFPVEKLRMIYEMREHGIHVVELTPPLGLAGKEAAT